MKIDGTAKVAETLKAEIAKHGRARITSVMLKDANTTAELIYQKLGGFAAGFDVIQSQDTDTYEFLKGCAHTEVTEEFTRLGPNRYQVLRTCDRCREQLSKVTRMGGESAARKHTKLPGYFPKAEPISEMEEAAKAYGSDDSNYGELIEKYKQKLEQQGLDGSGSSSDGAEAEGQGEGDGECSGEGQCDGSCTEDGDGEPCESCTKKAQEGKDGKDGKTPDPSTMDAFKGDGEGEDGEGESDGDPWTRAFKKHWEVALSGDQKATVYHRLTMFRG